MPPTATRIYRGLLVLAPRRLRDKHCEEMMELFDDALAAARAQGRLRVAEAWLRAIGDLLATRARELLRARRAPSVPKPRKVFMLGTDLKYTSRWLLRQKLSTALVAAMLALGIAANVVVFSLVDGLFLRPFPFHEPRFLREMVGATLRRAQARLDSNQRPPAPKAGAGVVQQIAIDARRSAPPPRARTAAG